ncbi:MAG: hypothetical protein HC880_00780 [Bacteroidia bacterium]|nr:hypothetical protein [Bacteroidia bacterium]
MSDELIDRSEQDRAEKDDKYFRERWLSDIRFIVKSKEGRRFYWGMMSKAGIFHEPFCGEKTNLTSYNLGRMSLGRDVLLKDLLEAKPEAYQQMQEEYKSEMISRKNIKIEETKKTRESGLI